MERGPRRELTTESHLVDIDQIRGVCTSTEARCSSGDAIAQKLMAGIALDMIIGNDPHPEAIAALERRLASRQVDQTQPGL